MRFLRPALALVLASAVACQEPTQVTIDVRLATAKCEEVHGTAIDVGVHPLDTEEKVKSKFPTAQTTDCDPAMAPARIGTLVITPSDEERGAVIVVAAYGTQRDPTECQPPDYKDCIVARRQFSFTKHRRMSLPITIDPTCVNVPCDAFSTCRKGFCFSAESTPCDGDDCIEPGETASGGTNTDAAVTPDGSTTRDGGPLPVGACEGATLRCGDRVCGANEQCCNSSVGARCRPNNESCAVRECCTSNDCGGQRCFTNGTPHGIPDAMAPDSGGPIVDDSGGPLDAGAPLDGSPPADSGSSPPDSGVPPTDSGTPPQDSGSPPFDGGSMPPDAGSMLPDAGGAPPALGICQ